MRIGRIETEGRLLPVVLVDTEGTAGIPSATIHWHQALHRSTDDRFLNLHLDAVILKIGAGY